MLTSERVQWIFHKNVKILVVDYSNLRWDEDFMTVFKATGQVLEVEKDIRVLLDVAGCYISSKVMLEGVKIIKPVRHNVVRRAIVGAVGYKLEFFRATTSFSKSTKFVKDRQEAQDYLIQ